MNVVMKARLESIVPVQKGLLTALTKVLYPRTLSFWRSFRFAIGTREKIKKKNIGAAGSGFVCTRRAEAMMGRR